MWNHFCSQSSCCYLFMGTFLLQALTWCKRGLAIYEYLNDSANNSCDERHNAFQVMHFIAASEIGTAVRRPYPVIQQLSSMRFNKQMKAITAYLQYDFWMS